MISEKCSIRGKDEKYIKGNTSLWRLRNILEDNINMHMDEIHLIQNKSGGGLLVRKLQVL